MNTDNKHCISLEMLKWVRVMLQAQGGEKEIELSLTVSNAVKPSIHAEVQLAVADGVQSMPQGVMAESGIGPVNTDKDLDAMEDEATSELTNDGDKGQPPKAPSWGESITIPGQSASVQIPDLRASLQGTPLGSPSLALLFQGLGDAYYGRFEAQRELADLDSSLMYSRAAVHATCFGDPLMVPRQALLAIVLHAHYDRLGILQDLDDSLALRKTILDLARIDDPNIASFQEALAATYGARFQRLAKQHDLDAALVLYQSAIDNTPEGDLLHERKGGLAAALLDRYSQYGSVDDLQSAILLQQAALDSISETHPGWLQRLISAAHAYNLRYLRFGSDDDLEMALNLRKSAVENTPASSSCQSSLADAYNTRFERFGIIDDLDQSIIFNEMALATTPEECPFYIECLSRLATAYGNKFEALGDPEAIESSLKYHIISMQRTPQDHPSMSHRYDLLAFTYGLRALRQRNAEDLQASLRYRELALEHTPAESPDLFLRLGNLAMSYSNLYGKSNALDDIQAALSFGNAALSGTPEDHASYARHQSILGIVHFQYYRQFKDLDSFATSIASTKIAVQRSPTDHPVLAKYQFILATAYLERFRHLGSLDDLESSVTLFRTALSNTPQGHPDYIPRQVTSASCDSAIHLYLEAKISMLKMTVATMPMGHQDIPIHEADISQLYNKRYRILGKRDDLDACLMYTGASRDTAQDDPDLASKHEMLSLTYGSRYLHHSLDGDCKLALDHARLALNNTPSDHPRYAPRMGTLAITHTFRYQRYGAAEDLQEAIHYVELILRSTQDDQPSLASKQSWLAELYRLRFRRFGGDSDDSLAYAKLALSNTPTDDQNYASCLSVLSDSYLDYYEQYGVPEDLQEAVKLGEMAMKATPANHPEFASTQKSLSKLYGSRYYVFGRDEDCNAYLEYAKLALSNTPTGAPGYTGCLSDLAMAHSKHYHRYRDANDIQEGIKHGESALKATPKDHRLLAHRQSNLATLYADRFKHFSLKEDCDAAVEYGKLALGNTPVDHLRDYSSHMSSLGQNHAIRYRSYKAVEDLQEAIKYQEEALTLTPKGYPGLAMRQRALAMSYSDRYRHSRLDKDCNAALEYHKIALSNTPTDNAEYPTRLSGLAYAYNSCFEQYNTPESLDQAIQYWELCLESVTEDRLGIYKAEVGNLANAYDARYKLLNNVSDREACLRLAKRTIGTPRVVPAHTWYTALILANLAFEYGSELALPAYKEVMGTLSDLLWIGSSISARHYALVQHDVETRVASAAASAIHFQQYELAAEFLEQGLAVIHQQSLKLKDRSSSLAHNYPDDANRLKELSATLLQMGESSTADVAQANMYHALATERDKLIDKIRTYDGYSDFFLPASYETLSRAASSGPVILLICASFRVDALIILKPSSIPILVELTQVDLEKSKDQVEKLRSALAECRIHHRSDSTDAERYGRPANRRVDGLGENFEQVLSWLWECVVGPVFTALGKHGVQGGRIWWCTSGPFNYLPIHAAASLGSPFIQSYTSSLGDLIRARERQSAADDRVFTSIGITAIPDRPALRLPLVGEELGIITSVLKDKPIKQLVNSEATISSVKEAIKSSSWLHFACHGVQAVDDPLDSHLILSDGDLSLRSILNMDADLASAKFVFLSACETAMGDKKLANEAMHFAAGFIVAGFKAAIGTLWSMSDADGPTVAKIVYEKMCEEGDGPDVYLAAEGLHLAVQQLRAQGAPPHRWIPFVHFGI